LASDTDALQLKSSHKIGKLLSPETYARIHRKIRRALSPIPLRPLLDKIDKERLREIQLSYGTSTENYAKYAHVERWLKRHIKKIQDLRLHRSPPKEILDLGCGGGFFLFIAKQFGHSVTGLDIDEFPLFGELLDLFEVPRKVWTIKPFEPLPDFERKFDWITAFSTRFNRDREDRHVWGVKEWEFFLDDLARRLRPAGKVFLEINSGKTRSYYPNDVRELFRRRGATLERDYVYFPTIL
jgi:SAM-dependent methyltransferase